MNEKKISVSMNYGKISSNPIYIYVFRVPEGEDEVGVVAERVFEEEIMAELFPNFRKPTDPRRSMNSRHKEHENCAKHII